MGKEGMAAVFRIRRFDTQNPYLLLITLLIMVAVAALLFLPKACDNHHVAITLGSDFDVSDEVLAEVAAQYFDAPLAPQHWRSYKSTKSSLFYARYVYDETMQRVIDGLLEEEAIRRMQEPHKHIIFSGSREIWWELDLINKPIIGYSDRELKRLYLVQDGLVYVSKLNY